MPNIKENPDRVPITDKEFYTEMARYANSTYQTAQKYWEAAMEVIIRQLYFRHNCRVPLLGNFNTVLREGTVQRQETKDGQVKYYDVPERLFPVFTPCDAMINDINFSGVTKAYRKRLNKGQLTQRDYERIARAEAVGLHRRELVPEQVEQVKQNFQEMLQRRKELTEQFNKRKAEEKENAESNEGE